MSFNKILIISLAILAGAGLVWATMIFINNSNSDAGSRQQATSVEKNDENFAKAVEAELPDKCKTPSGYTDKSWQEHMSHHPDRYKECFEAAAQKSTLGYHNITADDLSDMLKRKDFVLIDVHIPEQNHIPGTDMLVPFDEIVERQAELPQDKNSKLVIYCRSGSMSSRAIEDLQELGYSNIYNLEGGLIEWQKQNYPVENISL